MPPWGSQLVGMLFLGPGRIGVRVPLQVHWETLSEKKNKVERGWRDGSAIRSTTCSFGGSGVSSNHPHGVLQPWKTPVPGDQWPLLGSGTSFICLSIALSWHCDLGYIIFYFQSTLWSWYWFESQKSTTYFTIFISKETMLKITSGDFFFNLPYYYLKYFCILNYF